MNEPMTVEVLLDTYEDLVALEARVNVAAEYVLHENNPCIDTLITIMRILGTATALDAVEKLEEKL